MRAQYKACEPFLSITSKLEENAVVKEAQIKALKSITKNLLGIDLLDVKIVKERELEKELTPAEEFELYESEIQKLRINPQNSGKMRKPEDFKTSSSKKGNLDISTADGKSCRQ